MDRETRLEFRRVWRELKQADEDSRQLISLTVAVKSLTKKVDRFSLSVTGLATAVVADLIARMFYK